MASGSVDRRDFLKTAAAGAALAVAQPASAVGQAPTAPAPAGNGTAPIAARPPVAPDTPVAEAAIVERPG